MSGGWGDRFDPPCTKTSPHPRHTWGTGTCAGIADPAASAGCSKSCTVDCGRCKGDPLTDLKRRIRRALGFAQDGHGGVPFDSKPVWRDGYDEARRAVIRELEADRG